MKATGTHKQADRSRLTWSGLGMAMGVALLLAGCGSSSETAAISEELLLVYSGDYRGYYEPCG